MALLQILTQFLYDVDFATPVTGFEASDIEISGTANGGSPAVSNFTIREARPGIGGHYNFTFEVARGSSDGTVRVSIPAGVGASGVPGSTLQNLASNTYTLTIDTQRPVITVSPTTERISQQTTNAAPSGFSYLQGVSVDDNTTPIMVDGAVDLDFSTIGNYTITYTATDAAGNTSTATTTRVYTIVNSAAPTVAITSSAGASGNATNATTLSYTATFSEAVSGFLASEIVVAGTAGTSVSNFVRVSNTDYTFDVERGSSLGTVIVSIPAGVASLDIDSGTKNLASDPHTLTIDTVPPVVSTLETESEEVNNQKINKIAITFSKDIANNNISANSFTVTVDSSTPAVTQVVISGNKLTLTLDNNPIVKGSTVSLLYNKPTTGITTSVKDMAGNELASFADRSVVDNVNGAPAIAGTPGTTVAEDSQYTFAPVATDPDAVDVPNLVFSITNKPDWADFSTTTGVLTGTPRNPHVGTTSEIVITVSDGIESASLPAFDVEVTNTVSIPAATVILNTVAVVGVLYEFTPTLEADVGHEPVYQMTNKPSWVTIGLRTGHFSGTPTISDVGELMTTLSLGGGTYNGDYFHVFNLSIWASNAAPTITGIPNTGAVVDAEYLFEPVGADTDANDRLTYAIDPQPTWATFDTETGRLTGRPASTDEGTTAGIVITVKDRAGYTSSLSAFDVEVVLGNNAPTIAGTPPTGAVVGTSYSFMPTATDADAGDVLTYAIENQPAWATFSTTTGALTGTPASSHVGTTTGIVISVSDGTESASLSAFNLEVESTNTPPTITGTPNTTSKW